MLGLTDELYFKYVEFIIEKIGVTYNNDQKNTLNNRLMPLLISYKFEDFNKLYSELVSEKNGKLLSDFIGRVTTNHTYFYREHSHFVLLNQFVFPEFEKLLKTSSERKLRFWVSACSSGEEAYTLAMCLRFYFEKSGYSDRFCILATDISRKAIECAQRGIYRNSELKRLPQNLKSLYTRKIDEHHSEISDSIKPNVMFRSLNLVRESFPFNGKFDCIFLRNVMIYFDDKTKIQLLRQLILLLNENGYLFIGKTETLPVKFQNLKTIYPSVFKKCEDYER